MVSSDDVKTFTVPELKKGLLERGLNIIGKKQELVARLSDAIENEASKTDAPKKPQQAAKTVPAKESDAPKKPQQAAKIVPAKESESVKTPKVPAESQKKPTAATNDAHKQNGVEPETEAEGKTPTAEVPATAEASKKLTQAELLQQRAERFGGNSSQQVKKAARAERFGLPTPTVGGGAGVDVETLKRRTDRFGEVSSTKMVKLEEDKKKEERATRFKDPLADAEDEKKKQRAERFAVGVTAAA